MLDHLDRFTADVANYLVTLGLVTQNVLHVGFGDLQERGHCRRDVRGFGVSDWPDDALASVWPGDGVDQQIRVVLQIILRPHDLVARDLLGGHDGLFHAGQGADLAELGQLHVLEALGILSQTHMAHTTLDVVHKPALAVNRDDGDALACDESCILKNAPTAHDVLAHLAGLDFALANLDAANGREGFFQCQVFREVFGLVLFFRAVDGLKDADCLGDVFYFVVFGHKNNVRGAPIELVLVDNLRPVGGVVVPFFLVAFAGHGINHVAEACVGFVLALGVEVKEHRAVSVKDRLD